MYSRNRKKSKNGSVQIRNSNNRLQLVFTFEGKRHFISTGLGDTPYNRKQAQDKALEIERDIAYGQFNPYTNPRSPCKQQHIVDKLLVNFPIIFELTYGFYLLDNNQ